MGQGLNYKEILNNVVNQSKNPSIIEVGSESEKFILQAIDLAKNISLYIHGINSEIENKLFDQINYDGFTFSKINLGTENNKDKKKYNLNLIFTFLKWSKIDLLKINQNENAIDILHGAQDIFSKELVNMTLIEVNNEIFNNEDYLKKIIQFSKKFKLEIYEVKKTKLYALDAEINQTFDLKKKFIILKKTNYNLKFKLINNLKIENLIKKKLAYTIGNLPFFRGQDRLVRYFYPPDKFKDLNKGEIFTTNYFGIKYRGITSNYIDWGVYFKGGHEKGLVQFLKKEISKFDFLLDIGANTGTISLPFIFDENLKIVCFEPLTYSFNKLKENFENNNAPKKHKLYKLAISNCSKTSEIHFSKTNENTGFASINNFFKSKNLSTEKIELDTLDNKLKIRNKNIIIKIDVEGHEKEVIEGSMEILKNNKILMYLECRDRDVIEMMKTLGFKAFFFKFKGKKLNFLKNELTQDVILRNF